MHSIVRVEARDCYPHRLFFSFYFFILLFGKSTCFYYLETLFSERDRHKGNFSTTVPLSIMSSSCIILCRRPVHLRTQQTIFEQQKIFGCEGLAALPRDSLYPPAKNARCDGATGTLPYMSYSLQ